MEANYSDTPSECWFCPLLSFNCAPEIINLDYRPHKTLANPYPRTPAMAAGISRGIWKVEDIVALGD